MLWIEDSLMNGIEKQIQYWVRSSREDLRVGDLLLKQPMTRHGLFCLHLSMEKLLKALVSKATQEPAPKRGSLPILAKGANAELEPQQLLFLSTFDSFNIGILYMDDLRKVPRLRVAQGLA
jgi:HEPN domain-containing protein